MLPNFATVEDVALVLQQPIPLGKVAAAEFALLTASEAVRTHCRQQLNLIEDEAITLDSVGGARILLPELPVVDLTAVVENGTALTAADYLLGQYGILHRTGRRWARGVQVIAITYSHGFAVIPDLVMTITARAASRLYQAGLRAEESLGVPGVVSKTLGDFSVTFGGESTAEGTMGASAARALLLSEKDLLDRYRV